MSRYRPPQPESSKYITSAGRKNLQSELDLLWRKKRPEVTAALSAAAAEGDRSENAEYIYRKKELREIDARVRYLRKRLEGIIVVDRIPHDMDKVYFGAWVQLEDKKGHRLKIRIVGPDEFDTHESYISMDSPIGSALLGKTIGKKFSVDLPDGKKRYTIIDIHYQDK